ncbi:hypothetical protein ACF0H5_010059 [Mactra antiquata]
MGCLPSKKKNAVTETQHTDVEMTETNVPTSISNDKTRQDEDEVDGTLPSKQDKVLRPLMYNTLNDERIRKNIPESISVDKTSQNESRTNRLRGSTTSIEISPSGNLSTVEKLPPLFNTLSSVDNDSPTYGHPIKKSNDIRRVKNLPNDPLDVDGHEESSKSSEQLTRGEIPNSSDKHKLRNTTTVAIGLKKMENVSQSEDNAGEQAETRINEDKEEERRKERKKDKKKKKKKPFPFKRSTNNYVTNKDTDISGVDETVQKAWDSTSSNYDTQGRSDANYQHQIAELKKDNDDLKTRLSKVMSDLVTNNNPNITDLSDQNRPLKVGERYRELYDNEWTDAYEDLWLQNTTERGIINTLLNILINCYTECERIVKEEMDALEQSVLKVTKCRVLTDDLKLSFKQYKDLRKKNYQAGMVPTKQFQRSLIPTGVTRTPNVKKYIRLVYELCWLMSIQDPPVYLLYNVTPGARFDHVYFREYTKSGSECDYVVWPALLLHKNGPILYKGVMQGKTSQG